MIQQDSSQSQECTKPIIADCTFCTNTAIPEYDVIYDKTGLHRHCRDCAIEFGINETYPQKLSTDSLSALSLIQELYEA